MHSKAIRQPDGSLLIPAELVSRWDEQIGKSFEELTDEERESDRDQVRRYLPLIVAELKKHSG